MKKFLVLLIAIIGFGINVSAQKTINAMAVTSLRNMCNSGTYYKFLSFDYEGRIEFQDVRGANQEVGKKYGKYTIDNNNTIRIVWSNGYQETAQISYQSNGRLLVVYDGNTYYDYDLWRDCK